MKWIGFAPTAGLVTATLFVTGSSALAQTGKPEMETRTGSRIQAPVAYTPVPGDEARKATARFASCVYRRSPDCVIRLLDNSDPTSLDLEGAGLNGLNLTAKLNLESCLGKEATADRVQLKVDLGTLAEMFAEPAYLAANPVPPGWLLGDFPLVERRFVSKGKQLAVARGLADLGDCMVKGDPVQSDALIRTNVASAEELRAAQALAPAIGPCVYAGQTVTLTPANIRRWAASGLWQAERSRSLANGKAD